MDAKLLNDNEIVLVDDNQADRHIARICYSRSGLKNKWMEFKGGTDFLNYLGSVERKEKPVPALVLLDINMPERTGFEILKEVRSKSFFVDVPILVMLTGSKNEKDIKKSQEFGANGYVTKPTELSDYISFFKTLQKSS